MASTMNVQSVTNAGATSAFAATTVAGDSVKWAGGKLLVEFRNTTGSSITVSVAPIVTSQTTPMAGSISTPTRSLAVAAGADGAFEFSDGDVGAYVDSSGNVNFAYTTGNVGLLYRALKVA